MQSACSAHWLVHDLFLRRHGLEAHATGESNLRQWANTWMPEQGGAVLAQPAMIDMRGVETLNF